jgi:glycosyltransferase involved in cell wall biosynthesis
MKNTSYEQPKISVLMPVYNSAKYLAAAIESILNQTFSNFELILIDDGSSDESLSILNKYLELDSRCKVHSRPNKGIIATRNELVSYARADILAWMDSDDISFPDRLEKQYKFLKDHKNCMALGTEALLIDNQGDYMYPLFVSKSHEEIDNLNLSGQGSFICNPSVMFRKSAFLAVGGIHYEYSHAEDIDFYLRIAEIGRIEILPETLLYYRQHFSSVGYQHRESQINSAYKAINDARLRRNLPLLTEDDLNKTTPYASNHEIYIKWAWCSLGAGFFKTAFKYGMKSIKSNPLKFESYKFIVCFTRDYFVRSINNTTK